MRRSIIPGASNEESSVAQAALVALFSKAERKDGAVTEKSNSPRGPAILQPSVPSLADPVAALVEEQAWVFDVLDQRRRLTMPQNNLHIKVHPLYTEMSSTNIQ